MNLFLPIYFKSNIEELHGTLRVQLHYASFQVYKTIMKSGEMEHEMTLFHTMEPIEMFCSRHTIIFRPYLVSCGHLLTQDDTKHLECVIGYATSLYLVIEVFRK